MLKPKNIFPFLVCLSLFLFFGFCQAVVLYLEPSEGQYQSGDTFIAEIKIDTEEECINTIEADLEFSQDVLEAIDFSQGNSILTLWVKPPEINQKLGLVSFSGGIPGGYCGIIPGDPEPSNSLGRIVFRASEIGAETIGEAEARVEFLDSSQVLLNDGLGTPTKLITKGAVFTILSEEVKPPKDEWQEELEKDIIPPEPFEIEIHQDSTIFEEKYFIIFSTTDKQTGIDRYEVKEGKKDWQEASSPYLLEDQSLQSIIKVKAVDKAGSERIIEYTPKTLRKSIFYWIIILILAGVGVIWYILSRRIKK